MTRLHFHPEARREALALTEQFLAMDSELGQSFHQRLTRLLTLIESAPELFPERENHVRLVSLAPRFRNYFLAYIIWNEKVVVLAVGHAKRRPFYFENRLPDSESTNLTG